MQQNTVYGDLMGELATSLATSLELARDAGVVDDCIALDPGIGFGKSVAGNLEIIRRLSELTGFGRPLLVGPSRKSFIGATLGREHMDDRLFGTAAAVALAVANGASILRVHDVAAMGDVVALAAAVVSG